MTPSTTHWLRVLAIEKDAGIDAVAAAALDDDALLGDILDGLVSRNDTYRYNCIKSALHISERQPARLYAEWNTFAAMLTSDNPFYRGIGVHIVAALSLVDSEDHLGLIFDDYFDLLNDQSVITARYLARSASEIALARPDLQGRIVASLLAIDKTRHTPERRELIKSDIIESFGKFYEAAGERAQMQAFVAAQVESSNPRTRQAAQDFLQKHGE